MRNSKRRGGVGAKDYVLHIRWYDGLTLCGRVASVVNCASEPVLEPEREEICVRCLRSRKKDPLPDPA